MPGKKFAAGHSNSLLGCAESGIGEEAVYLLPGNANHLHPVDMGPEVDRVGQRGHLGSVVLVFWEAGIVAGGVGADRWACAGKSTLPRDGQCQRRCSPERLSPDRP